MSILYNRPVTCFFLVLCMPSWYFINVLVHYINLVFSMNTRVEKMESLFIFGVILFSGLNANLCSSQFHWTSQIHVTSLNVVFVFWCCINTISLIYQTARKVLQFVVENSRDGALDFLLRMDIVHRTRWPRGLRPLAHWNCGFEPRRWHGCLSLVSVACCQLEVFASGWSFVHRIPTEFEVSKWVWSWSLANEKGLVH